LVHIRPTFQQQSAKNQKTAISAAIITNMTRTSTFTSTTSVKSLKLSYYGHTTWKHERLEEELIQATEVVVDNADVGRTTSSSGQGWR